MVVVVVGRVPGVGLGWWRWLCREAEEYGSPGKESSVWEADRALPSAEETKDGGKLLWLIGNDPSEEGRVHSFTSHSGD
ncbi:hypothetical protein INR49_004128 [Caranx melampygus]|nr:hypothetical protein INR49_004128 [Caranx melampygus]